jgi:hypothetical protein
MPAGELCPTLHLVQRILSEGLDDHPVPSPTLPGPDLSHHEANSQFACNMTKAPD